MLVNDEPLLYLLNLDNNCLVCFLSSKSLLTEHPSHHTRLTNKIEGKADCPKSLDIMKIRLRKIRKKKLGLSLAKLSLCWSLKLEFEVEAWSGSLKLLSVITVWSKIWSWSMKLKVEFKVWSWSLNWEFEVEVYLGVWSWSLFGSLKLKFEV